MATIGSLAVNLKANTQKFVKGMNKAQKSIGRLKKSIPGLNFLFSKMGLLTGGLAGGGLVLMLKKTAENVDELAKFSKRIGVSTEALAGLELAAGFTGVKVNQLRLGLQRMTRRVSEAAQGMGEAQGAIKELGLDAEKLNKMSVDEQFRAIAGAMEAVEGQSNKVRLAFKLFDSEGVSLVNTLSLGEEGLQRVAKEAKELGVAFNEIDAAKVEEANDALKRVESVFTGAMRTAVIEFAPLVESIATSFVEWAKAGDGVKGKVLGLIRAVLRGVDAVQLAFAKINVVFAETAVKFQEATQFGGADQSALYAAADARNRVRALKGGADTATAWFEGLKKAAENSHAKREAEKAMEKAAAGLLAAGVPSYAPDLDAMKKAASGLLSAGVPSFAGSGGPAPTPAGGKKAIEVIASFGRSSGEILSHSLEEGIMDGIRTGFDNARDIVAAFGEDMVRNLIGYLGKLGGGKDGIGGILGIVSGISRAAGGGNFQADTVEVGGGSGLTGNVNVGIDPAALYSAGVRVGGPIARQQADLNPAQGLASYRAGAPA